MLRALCVKEILLENSKACCEAASLMAGSYSSVMALAQLYTGVVDDIQFTFIHLFTLIFLRDVMETVSTFIPVQCGFLWL